MLDRAQLALASDEERARALRSEQQEATRERARVARERALRGDATAARAVQQAFMPLVPDVCAPERCVPRGVVVN